MIRLSYSALDILQKCERLFQLDRLLIGAPPRQDYPATVLGKAFGEAVQTYLLTQDADLSILKGYLAYYPILEEPDKGRTEEHFISLFLTTIPHLDQILSDWEVAIFNSKPAVELSFRLNINERFYYVGYVDVVLRNKYSGQYAVGEIKTTGMKLQDLSPIYQNSSQAIGYSIILDQIAGEENADYSAYYIVGQLSDKHSHTIKTYPFQKTLLDRLNWFISLSMDVNRLTEMLDNNIFPMRGSSCLQYMRPCKHFGTCSLHSLDEYKVEEIDEIEYSFTFELDDVIQDHIKRIA